MIKKAVAIVLILVALMIGIGGLVVFGGLGALIYFVGSSDTPTTSPPGHHWSYEGPADCATGGRIASLTEEQLNRGEHCDSVNVIAICGKNSHPLGDPVCSVYNANYDEACGPLKEAGAFGARWVYRCKK